MTKRALVVDDSKTARQVMSGQLANHGITVDTCESAGAAIDYLSDRTPDAIFMDYEMPGMDGFQALKVIKSNPDTALIPIMMYTSKEEGLELSRAMALGAVGVLPKQFEPQDLEVVLQSLHLLPTHELSPPAERDATTDEMESDPASDEIHPDQQQDEDENLTQTVSHALNRLQDQASLDALKRLMRREHDLLENRIKEKMDLQTATFRHEMNDLGTSQQEINRLGRHLRMLGLLAILITISAVYLISNYLSLAPSETSWSNQEWRDTRRVLRLIEEQNLKLDQVAQMPASEPVAEMPDPLPIALIEWAANQGSHFKFGTKPFDDERALWLAELVGQLKSAGFTGSIELHTHYGNFCLLENEAGEQVIPGNNASLQGCYFLADLVDEGDGRNDQSVAFANYLNVERARSGGEIDIVLFNRGFDDPLVKYPDMYQVSTVGEWNFIAEQNHRVRVHLRSYR